MKVVLALAVFACVAAMVAADGYRYRPGFRKTKNDIVARYNNAARQEYVNHKAEYVGASSGTARYDGVPGTGNNFGYRYGYKRDNGYGHDDHHDNGYGHDDHHDNGYGHDDHHDNGYGHDDRHDNGYGHDDHHDNGYGYDRHDNRGYGRDRYNY